MEANKVYIDSINTLTNIIKNEQLRTKLLEDSDLKQNFIHLIDNLLYLEIEHNCLYNNNKASALLGKALVNICKEKIKFEKPEDKSVDDAFGDVMFLQTYCLNKYQISRESLVAHIIVNEENIKDYQKITDEMKSKYLNAPEPEVVDPKVEQPNTNSTNQQSNTGANGQTGFNTNWNQNTFLQGAVPIHPLQDPRFYPYNSKPKHMRHIRLGLGILMALMSIFYIVITIFVSVNHTSIGADVPGQETWFDGWKILMGTNTGKSLKGTWYLGFSIGVKPAAAGSIIMMIIMALLMAWMVYAIIQKPKRYKDQFMIPGMTLFIPVMFVIMIFITFLGPIQWMFGANLEEEYAKNIIFQNLHPGLKPGKAFQAEFDKWYTESNANDIKLLVQYLKENLNFSAAKGLIATMFTIIIISIGFVIAILFINPRMDREKVAYANEEYQKMVAAAMQGQSYTIDPNIYESEQEIQDFIDYVKGNKKKEDKDNNPYH